MWQFLGKRTIRFWLGLVILLTWLITFTGNSNLDINPVGRGGTTGFNHLWGQEFIYFYHHLGLFPLTTTEEKVDNKEDAQRIIDESPSSLRMEHMHWARFGESARIYLYYPHVWFSGGTSDPDIRDFNRIFWILAVLGLYISLFWAGSEILAFVLALLFTCSPFLIYEIQVNQNVFGLMACLAILCSAIFFPLMKYKINWLRAVTLVMFSGIIMGFFYHVRAETLPLLGTMFLVLVFIPGYAIWRRGVLLLILIGSFVSVRVSFENYFDSKFEETTKVVDEAGGPVFSGGRTVVHPFWHPFYCGLGDFDTKYGYRWQDTIAYAYAMPILRERSGDALPWPGETIHAMGEYYDADSLYYKKPETVEGYDDVIKAKVLGDIKSDPLWYAGIILQRIHMFFWDVSPIEMRVWNFSIPIPFTGYVAIILAAWLVYRRHWWRLKLLIFTLPLATSSILIYSGEHNTYMSLYHMVTLAILIELFIKFVYPLIQQRFHLNDT